MNLKFCKKAILCMFCALFLCMLIPAVRSQAGTCKRDGCYVTFVSDKKSAKKNNVIVYSKKIFIKNNRLTTYGNYLYYKSFNALAANSLKSKSLGAHKRIFKISKNVKYYIYKNKYNKISKAKVNKILNKRNGKYLVIFTMKNYQIKKVIFVKDEN